MGHEITLYVGRVFPEMDNWLDVRATFELYKYPYDSALRRVDSIGIPCFFFGTDGNSRYSQDKYGVPLHAIPAEVVIAAMKEDGGHWCLPSLEALKANFDEWRNDLRVVLYGH